MAVSHESHRTRPLCLSNTDSKIRAIAANQSLTKTASKLCCSEQQGFVTGRTLTHNIVNLDGASAAWAMHHSTDLAVLFIDFAAAFLSVSTVYLWQALWTIGVSSKTIAAIRTMYNNSVSHVILGSCETIPILLQSGIKQGCPLSGTLFALLMDPILRFLNKLHPRDSVRFFAYADDIAVLLHHMSEQLPFLAFAQSDCTREFFESQR